MKDRILVGIATKQRPEYLSSLLGTLMFQTAEEWDLMIVDTDPVSSVFENVQVERFLRCFEALGHHVYRIQQPTHQKSEVSAINRILVEADLMGYGFIFKVDDDHVMPPLTLEYLRSFLTGDRAVAPTEGVPAIVSGVSPWMEPAWDGAIGPSDIRPTKDGENPADMWVEERDDETLIHFNNGHFYRWEYSGLKAYPWVVPNKRVHPANFMMRPDSRILWTELGSSSMYADSVWSIQLQTLLKYEIYMDLTVNVWHVAAPHGGVREEVGNHLKDSTSDNLRKQWLIKLLKDTGLDKPGVKHDK